MLFGRCLVGRVLGGNPLLTTTSNLLPDGFTSFSVPVRTSTFSVLPPPHPSFLHANSIVSLNRRMRSRLWSFFILSFNNVTNSVFNKHSSLCEHGKSSTTTIATTVTIPSQNHHDNHHDNHHFIIAVPLQQPSPIHTWCITLVAVLQSCSWEQMDAFYETRTQLHKNSHTHTQTHIVLGAHFGGETEGNCKRFALLGVNKTSLNERDGSVCHDLRASHYNHTQWLLLKLEDES
eukprot:m.705839 g.705839  ORF g.705839 m.705839 type:complete len:233 (-) comp22930_c0_seq4:4-702(-)